MRSKIILFIILTVFSSVIFNQQKLSFSADIAESFKKNNVKVKIFKNNVKIIDQNKILYTDLAEYFQDSSKVILNGSVKMYDTTDSLTCDKLILIKGDNERYEASGNVIFYQNNHIIKAQNLIYYIIDDKIIASDNVLLRDQTREVLGDSLMLHYNNNLISNLIMVDNIQLINQKTYFLKDNFHSQILEDNMQSNTLFIKFDDNENIDNIRLSGMATANLHVVKDSLLKGLNSVSGDTIFIQFQDDLLSQMNINGGAMGTFKPDPKNKKLNNDISYNAEHVIYNLIDEITLLDGNAIIHYGQTILEGGLIETDLKNNIVKSKIKYSILPSVKTETQPPTYGDYMKFDLITETGNITNGYNEIDMGIFKGDNFFTNKNEDVYIDHGMFTSCDHPDPHYYFGSRQMKVDHSSSQIIAKPMTLYIQDLPTFSLPFAILPNSNQNRKSGFMMPAFGHNKDTGTWIQDLGYYYAPNDYYDITTYLDFYDRSRVQLDSKLRYKKLYGNHWYNYQFTGFLQLKNYINKLIEPNQDFTDLGSDATKEYSIIWMHNQDFSNNQYLRIQYEYYGFESLADIIENDINARLDQQETSQLFYSRTWDYGSLTIGGSSIRDLILPDPEYEGQIRTYKNIEYPVVTYRYNNPLLFGNGDQWYHSTKFGYNFSAYNKKTTYSKQSVWSPAIEALIWEDLGISNTRKPSAEHNMFVNMPISLFSFNINPRLSLTEHWAISDVFDNEDFYVIARKIKGTFGLNIQTTLYGIVKNRIFNAKVKTIRHVMTPSINTNYVSKTKILKGSAIDFEDTYYPVDESNNPSNLVSSISLNNLFQAKIINSNGEFFKRDILSYNLFTSYNWDTKLFNSLLSTISFKNKSGGEYLSIDLTQSLYKEDTTELLNGLPRLTGVRTSFSRTFGYELIGENLDNSENENSSSKSNDYLSEDLWDATFGFTLTAKYDLVDKWNLEYSTLSVNSNVNLSKEWNMNNKMYIDLVDMTINSYELEFTRSLHCWDFSFMMKTIGYNKGFGLKISISDPNLQSIKVTQSTMKRGNNW